MTTDNTQPTNDTAAQPLNEEPQTRSQVGRSKKIKQAREVPPYLPRPLVLPHEPWERQQVFLKLNCLEALYGGAAGGGKSEALLMAALQYIHLPGYSALILRKDLQRLRLSGGLIPRSHEWLAKTDAKWNNQQCCWTFRTAGAPATLRFGYLASSFDKYRYASSEFQFIAFDELTEFAEDDYLFLFSRLRKTNQFAVPLRMRAASNPGGVGQAWVKNRFIPPDFSSTCIEPLLWTNDRAFVPALIEHNPALNAEEYRRSLGFLPAGMRDRLMNGNWFVQDETLLQKEWLRYYIIKGNMLELYDVSGRALRQVYERECRRIITVDPAGTSAERARQTNRKPSATAIQVWDCTTDLEYPAMILRDAWRGFISFDELGRRLKEFDDRWDPSCIWIEKEYLGQATIEMFGKELPLKTVSTNGKKKLERANYLLFRLERGEVFLPRDSFPWKEDFEKELLAWTGRQDEANDQIDAAAYAAILSERTRPKGMKLAGRGSVVR